MKKQLLTVVLVIVSTFSFANNGNVGKDLNNHFEGTEHMVRNINLLETSSLLSGNRFGKIINNQIIGINKDQDHTEKQSLISKTISVFGNGIKLARFQVQMSRLKLVKGSGWVHQKEWNLHADKTNNGLSIRYKF